MFKIHNKKEVRRYNFICNHRVVYSGLFIKNGLLDFHLLYLLKEKRDYISRLYNINPKDIIISNTLKG